ncbi:hypothetical protein [Mesobacillus foraminis]|uniref:Uncharacterized protein n=1 Tax=Mesobacillus foraminis TaxID=279826 RepID=A0A4R2AUN0_9BACI|nr:hypothetical protein [Mesobacillus foraminis]TCN17541.1 hypothetical protein EV146_1256 [Mesobacillus foraminis]
MKKYLHTISIFALVTVYGASTTAYGEELPPPLAPPAFEINLDVELPHLGNTLDEELPPPLAPVLSFGSTPDEEFPPPLAPKLSFGNTPDEEFPPPLAPKLS